MRDGASWRAAYRERIDSFAWRGKRMRLITERGGVCERCGRRRRPLHLHHKTYERLGRERDSDLEVVCVSCHRKADAERAAKGARRSSTARHNARIDGWASRKYGEDWADYLDRAEVADEFDEWLETTD